MDPLDTVITCVLDKLSQSQNQILVKCYPDILSSKKYPYSGLVKSFHVLTSSMNGQINDMLTFKFLSTLFALCSTNSDTRLIKALLCGKTVQVFFNIYTKKVNLKAQEDAYIRLLTDMIKTRHHHNNNQWKFPHILDIVTKIAFSYKMDSLKEVISELCVGLNDIFVTWLGQMQKNTEISITRKCLLALMNVCVQFENAHMSTPLNESLCCLLDIDYKNDSGIFPRRFDKNVDEMLQLEALNIEQSLQKDDEIIYLDFICCNPLSNPTWRCIAASLFLVRLGSYSEHWFLFDDLLKRISFLVPQNDFWVYIK